MSRFKGTEVCLTKNLIAQIARPYTGNPEIRNLYTDIDGMLVLQNCPYCSL